MIQKHTKTTYIRVSKWHVQDKLQVIYLMNTHKVPWHFLTYNFTDSEDDGDEMNVYRMHKQEQVYMKRWKINKYKENASKGALKVWWENFST